MKDTRKEIPKKKSGKNEFKKTDSPTRKWKVIQAKGLQKTKALFLPIPIRLTTTKTDFPFSKLCLL